MKNDLCCSWYNKLYDDDDDDDINFSQFRNKAVLKIQYNYNRSDLPNATTSYRNKFKTVNNVSTVEIPLSQNSVDWNPQFLLCSDVSYIIIIIKSTFTIHIVK